MKKIAMNGTQEEMGVFLYDNEDVVRSGEFLLRLRDRWRAFCRVVNITMFLLESFALWFLIIGIPTWLAIEILEWLQS